MSHLHTFAVVRPVQYWTAICLGLFWLGLCGTASAAAGWKAGVAKADITPEQPMWMAGYGSRDHRATGTRSSLWGKVLVLEDSRGHRAAAITLDLVGIGHATSADLCQRLAKEHQLQRADIAIFCSHTHCGPVVDLQLMPMYDHLSEEDRSLIAEYTTGFIDEVVAAVGQAISDLTPAELAWSRGQVGFAVNRRNNREADVPDLRAAGELRGPSDHEVPVLQVNCGDQIKAIVFGYACHATTLDFYEWCADYPGYAMQGIEEEYPGTLAMFWAGCGADQNPLPRRKVELAEHYGHRLATEVQSSLISNVAPVTGDLDVRYETIEVPFASLPTAEELNTQLESTDVYISSRAKRLKQELDTNGSIRPTYAYPVQTWKLGDGPLWVILSGEVVVDYSIRLKTELRMKYPETPIWVASYANDVMAYIPSLRVLEEGGYEGGGAMVYFGLPSPWAKTIEEQIVRAVQEQVQSLQTPSR